MSFSIEVENLKCSGCAKSIQKALAQLPLVDHVSVDLEKEMVILDGNPDIEKVTQTLRRLGYPLKGENSAIRRMVSYASCIAGRIKS